MRKGLNLSFFTRVFTVFIVFPAVLLAIQGCDGRGGQKPWATKLTTDYQAVFLDNGQVFFGNIEDPGSQYIQLSDVFYVRSEPVKDTKEVKSVLIKRGSEWHGPDRMYINSNHITLIEPVAPTSKVGELIKEAGKKTGAK